MYTKSIDKFESLKFKQIETPEFEFKVCITKFVVQTVNNCVFALWTANNAGHCLSSLLFIHPLFMLIVFMRLDSYRLN